MQISKDYTVSMENITKYFGVFKALDGVDLEIKKGEIHAILGENGAGKSTLMNILYGLYRADSGEIYIDGTLENIKNPRTAISLGIGMVHQHFMLIDKFTALENIILGNEFADKFGIIKWCKAKKQVIKIMEEYGLSVDLKKRVKHLTVGMQQKVEIIKAIYRGADTLILDEPTAVLTPQEIDNLMKIIKGLKKSGKTVIIITHKLNEIKDCAEKCTIIRKGKFIETVDVENESEQSLAEKMVGRKVKLNVDKTKAQPKDVIFEIENLHVKNEKGFDVVKDLSLQIRSGEILGLAGVDGNGQTELLQTILGRRLATSGKIKISGKEIQNTSTLNILNNKVSIIHADRHKYGIVLDMTVTENAILEKYRDKKYCKKGFLNNEECEKFTDELISEYDIRPIDCKHKKIRCLSGGNQQKLIIGREIANEPNLLIAVQPTRGLDVGAIEYIHKMLIKLRDSGKAILLISLELDETMDLSDRVAVIYKGKITGEFCQEEIDEQKIGLLMGGGKKNEKSS